MNIQSRYCPCKRNDNWGTLCSTAHLTDDIRSLLLRSSQSSKLTLLQCLGESVDIILGRVGLDLSMMLFFVLFFSTIDHIHQSQKTRTMVFCTESGITNGCVYQHRYE
ncbi:G-protein coupled receptor [Trichinella pseudospiralis]